MQSEMKRSFDFFCFSLTYFVTLRPISGMKVSDLLKRYAALPQVGALAETLGRDMRDWHLFHGRVGA